MNKLSFVVLAGLFTCGLASPVMAQERSDASYQREVSFGYSFLRDVGQSGSRGFLFDVGKQVRPNTSLIAEFAVNHFPSFEETYTTIGGGIRFGRALPKVRPFAQMLVGIQRDFGATGFNIQPGAGLSVRLGPRADAKVQVDFPIVRWEGETYEQFRLNIGVGMPLGR